MNAASLTARRTEGLRGTVMVPGDKSISHRALIMAAMAEGESRLTGLSDAVDLRRTAVALEALGAQIDFAEDHCLVRGGPWRSPSQPLECGNSGTTARLLMGAVAGRGVRATFTGDSSLGRRPMARVTEPLSAMGARIEGASTLPITLSGGTLRAIRHVNRPASAQVKSAILLAGIGAQGLVEVIEMQPTRDHSERLLPLFGVKVERSGTSVGLQGPCRLTPADVDIAGDMSAAAFPLVAALICPRSSVHLPGVGVNPLRTGLLRTLREMGAHIGEAEAGERSGEPVADLTARTSPLRGVTVPAERAPSMIDEYPALTVAAACAAGETVMHGLGELRVKESDRLALIVEGLTACGVRAGCEGDTLRVTGGVVPGGAAVRTDGDHRIVMAFLVLGLVSDAPIRVDRADMIATSFPGFAALMRSLGARIEAA